jgi:hypothetical protein
MVANPLKSAGARLERKSLRTYLRRKIASGQLALVEEETYKAVLDWVMKRQARYDKRVGGLGKK